MLAALILGFHVSIIAFNLFGLVAIPLGAWRGCAFVHAPLWRILHIASLGAVALQAAMGRACFLTLWQGAVEGQSGVGTPLIMKWVNSMIFWPLPLWAFAVLYMCAFGYVIALLRLVPLLWK